MSFIHIQNIDLKIKLNNFVIIQKNPYKKWIKYLKTFAKSTVVAMLTFTESTLNTLQLCGLTLIRIAMLKMKKWNSFRTKVNISPSISELVYLEEFGNQVKSNGKETFNNLTENTTPEETWLSSLDSKLALVQFFYFSIPSFFQINFIFI